MSFWEAFPILQNGIFASVVAALVCSFLGVYVILKRMVFMAAALSQVSSLGIAVALPLQMWIWSEVTTTAQNEAHSLTDLFPIVIAILFACAAASLMARQSIEKRLTRESMLGIAYVVPTALALLVLDSSGGTVHDINNLLFGNTVFVPSLHLWLLTIIGAIVILIHGILYEEFIFISFDPETAKTSGLPTVLLNQLLFGSLAIMISVSITAIGVLPVFSFIVLPSAAALAFTNTLKQVFILAVCFGGIAVLAGFYLSYVFSLPTGPTIIVVESLFFLAAIIKNIYVR